MTVTTAAPANGPHIRIAIDARPFAGSPCGYTIYLESVIHCLRAAGLAITLFGNNAFKPIYPELHGLPTEIFGRIGDLGWEQRDLPARLATADYDLYFAGANRGMPLRKNPRIRYILGLLDVIPYKFFGNYYLRNWKAFLRSPTLKRETVSQLVSVARADAILTISRQSAIDIRRIFHRRDVTSHLIRLKDVDVPPPPAAKRQFVYVGGVDFRKKIDVLLHAFAAFVARHPDHRLILVGSNYSSQLPLIERLGLADHVVLTGYVDHDTKFRILGESIAMVYPSLYEGYGLAISEGFQAGIPVIAGRGGSQEEVGGAGVRAIDPSSSQDIAAAMAEMLDPAVRADWIARGQAQLRALTDPAIETALVAYFTEQARLSRAAHG